jgi:hypothetical protein
MHEATQRTRTELTSLHAKRRRSAYVIALCCVAAIGGFLFGFDSGVINGTVDALAKAFRTDAAGTGFAVARLTSISTVSDSDELPTSSWKIWP